MSGYRIFERTWWRDAACTIPGVGRKRGARIVKTEAEARAICQRENAERPGIYVKRWGKREFIPNRGPRGLATEYEAAP